MKFELVEVSGMTGALLGMRLPMCKDLKEVMEKSDSCWIKDNVYIANTDEELCKKLIAGDSGEKASGHGQPNSKFLRMIHAQICVTAPLYWWKEADTYKVGTTSNSTSTMHRLANYPITMDCFEMDDFNEVVMVEDNSDDRNDAVMNCFWTFLLCHLEILRQKYNETKDKRYWKELVRLLPESWLQTRMLDVDYQTLRNIYFWRKNHKLTEWHSFCDFIKTLPESWLITGEE